MIETIGYFNNNHRKWKFTDTEQYCQKCFQKNENDSKLEMFLRFKLKHLLTIENDNFTEKFNKYHDIIEFIFKIPPIKKKLSFINIIQYIFEQKLIFGVGFRMKKGFFNENVNYDTSNNYVIPILAFGKMWEIIFDEISSNNSNSIIIIDEQKWRLFNWNPSFSCLFCNNFPFGIYPGNFIVSQNILYMRGFIWMDKRRFHYQKNTGEIIAYNNSSNIVSWPFLKNHMKIQVNHLGNMVCYTSAEIFSNLLDNVINKIKKIILQNELVDKNKNIINLTVNDLKLMYRYCRRKKKYNIKNFQQKSNLQEKEKEEEEEEKRKKNEEDKKKEDCIITIIQNFQENDNIGILLNRSLLDWFRYPKTKTNLSIIIQEMSQMIKRGEIDSAITQTSILNKDYSNINTIINNTTNSTTTNATTTNNNNFHQINIDVHRIGRFTRNVSTNDFWNMCSIACGVQKVLPKDSRIKEPKLITKSEIGFLDLVNTPDAPRNCGLILETVLDTVVSTSSMICKNIERVFRESIFPNNFEKVSGDSYEEERGDNGYIYICVNFNLFRFKPIIPHSLKPEHLIYICINYGVENYFRMTQYALKIKYPCIELLKESDKFWICTSQTRTFYKIHTDGLLYTAKEMDYFEKNIISSSSSDSKIWIGENNRDKIGNIFGPTMRAIPRPNTCHLPRIAHACSSSYKHAIGIVTNTHQRAGAIHQKNMTISHYCQKIYSNDLCTIPGVNPLILVAGGFNNQEDGIVVRKSAIERGLFVSTCYETASVRISYSIFSECKIKFISTIKKGQILRKGLRIGYFRNKTVLEEEEEEEEDEEEKEEGDDDDNDNNNNNDENERNDDNNNDEKSSKEGKKKYNNNKQTTSSKDKLIDLFSSEIKLVRCNFITGLYSNNINNIIEKEECLAVIWEGHNDDDDDDDDDDDENYNNKRQYKCFDLKCINVKHMKHLKMYLIYSYEFNPTIGDKLQTSTSQKGVITQLISDENMPYIVSNNNMTMMIPDIIVNPQYLKRQTFDNLFNVEPNNSNNNNTPFLNNCFSYDIADTLSHIEFGAKVLTGKLMNPITGFPYMKPKNGGRYKKPFLEELGSDGFTYISKNNDENSYEIIEGSIYICHYFNVSNHRADHMMQSSKCDDIIRTDFSGAPIRGRKGGFSTGPQEQLALIGIGMNRFNREISLIRSDYSSVVLNPKIKCDNGNDDDDDDDQIFAGSTTFKRMHDDLNMRGLNVTYKIRKYNKE